MKEDPCGVCGKRVKRSFDAVFNLPERDRDREKEIRRKKERGAETGIRKERKREPMDEDISMHEENS